MTPSSPRPNTARYKLHFAVRRIAAVSSAAVVATTMMSSSLFASPRVASPDASVRRTAIIRAAIIPTAISRTAISRSPMIRSDARRHLKLVKTSPAADTTVATAPTAIRLWLSEPADLPATKISLSTAAGVAVRTNAVTRAAAKDAPLEATIPTPLANGGYTVSWKAMSKDGHVVKGTFAFTVGAK